MHVMKIILLSVCEVVGDAEEQPYGMYRGDGACY